MLHPLGSAVFSTLTLLSIAAAFAIGWACGRASSPPAPVAPIAAPVHDLEHLGGGAGTRRCRTALLEPCGSDGDPQPARPGRTTSWSAYGF